MRRVRFEATAAANVVTGATQRRNTVAADPLRHDQLAPVGRMLLQLQRHYGNRYVQRVVHAHRARGAVPVTRPSLPIGPVDDRHEHAAESVAQQVAGGAPARRAAGGAGTGPVLPAPQRVSAPVGGLVDGRVRQAIQGARGGGQPLPEHVRDSMEPVVGMDLSQVRLHTDARADQLTRLLRARAFTTGPEIFLRRGEYLPGSIAGQRLLAHELTHVAQQTGGAVNADGVSGPPLGVAPAGVIQRMKIGDHDTEDELGLGSLKKQVRKMKNLSDIEAMQSEIEKQVHGRKPTGNVRDLLDVLNVYREALASQTQKTSERSDEPKSEDAVAEPVNMLTKWSRELTDLGTNLKDGPGEGSGAVKTWLQNVDKFLQEHDKWNEKFRELQPATRLRHSKALSLAPLRKLAQDLEGPRKDIGKRFEKEQAEKAAIAKPEEEEEEAQKAALFERKQEVWAEKRLVRRYFHQLEYKLGSQAAQDWEKQKGTPYGLFLQWVFTAVIAKADKEKGASPWIAALLGYLESRRTPGPGLFVTVIGQSGNIQAYGMTNDNHIRLFIDLSPIKDPVKFLTGKESSTVGAREKLVAQTASTFIHEAAHVRQMVIYANGSNPWRVNSPPFEMLQIKKEKFTGVRFDDWPVGHAKCFH